MRSSALKLFGAVAIGVLAAGCGDQSATTSPAPAGAAADRSLLSILGGPTAVHPITRNTPLAAPLTATATIGVLGGRLSIPAAGITVVVPALAVTRATQFKITAVAGSQVAYEFEPHGTQYIIPLIATQSLVGTSAVGSGGLLSNNPLIAGYFASASQLNQPGGTALISELLSTALNLSAKSTTFPIFHFSGWLVATGREDGDVDSVDGVSQQ